MAPGWRSNIHPSTCSQIKFYRPQMGVFVYLGYEEFEIAHDFFLRPTIDGAANRKFVKFAIFWEANSKHSPNFRKPKFFAPNKGIRGTEYSEFEFDFFIRAHLRRNLAHCRRRSTAVAVFGYGEFDFSICF